jgi:deoxyribose-phosphate aldolase
MSRETKQALQAGALELDIVLNYGQLKAGDYASVFNELATLRLQAPHPVLLKLILETSQLDRSQIIAACTMAAAANFDFVKTSSGFSGHGAKEEHVRLMAACCEKLAVGGRKKMEVKASGGIRTIEDAVKMLEAGATRLGTSNGVWIAKEGKETAERSRSPPSVSERRGSRPELSTRLFTDY